MTPNERTAKLAIIRGCLDRALHETRSLWREASEADEAAIEGIEGALDAALVCHQMALGSHEEQTRLDAWVDEQEGRRQATRPGKPHDNRDEDGECRSCGLSHVGPCIG